jgi:hypothetical protein
LFRSGHRVISSVLPMRAGHFPKLHVSYYGEP